MSKCGACMLDIFDLRLGMLTREQLADMLGKVNAQDVAREAQVSLKTVYRLRHQTNAPTLDVVLRIVEACKRLSKAAA